MLSASACQQVIGLDEYEISYAVAGAGGSAGKGSGGSAGSDGGEGGSAGGNQGGSAGSGGSAGAEGGSAGTAGDGGTAGTAGVGGASGAAGSGGTAGSGGSAGSGGTAGSAGSAGSGGGATCHENELLKNPSFDAGDVDWLDFSTQGLIPIIYDEIDTPVYADTPDYLAWLGGWEDEVDGVASDISRLQQSVVIPPGAVAITVTGYVQTYTVEPSTEVEYDWADMWLLSGATTVATIGHWSNLTLIEDWTVFEKTFDATELGGQTLLFQIRSESDGLYVTQFYFDTLSMKATCP